MSGTVNYGQDQEVLKAWHYLDPPDSYEISRNDFLDSLQGNRNPFIDSMQYACYIDFTNMTKLTGVTAPCGSFVGLTNKAANQVDFSVFLTQVQEHLVCY
ncbi:MAG: endonuclease [Bacteroidetes bacterium]|nr:endonuclease [Bacteroidota bacterium]